jgi:DNA-binding PadR family transcriptional regulator
VNAIGEMVHLTSGSITAAIDRMEARGLVERRSHATDRRTRLVHLTDTGRELIQCAFADHEAAMDRAASGLAAEERLDAVALLKKLGLRAQAELNRTSPARPPGVCGTTASKGRLRADTVRPLEPPANRQPGHAHPVTG